MTMYYTASTAPRDSAPLNRRIYNALFQATSRSVVALRTLLARTWFLMLLAGALTALGAVGQSNPPDYSTLAGVEWLVMAFVLVYTALTVIGLALYGLMRLLGAVFGRA